MFRVIAVLSFVLFFLTGCIVSNASLIRSADHSKNGYATLLVRVNGEAVTAAGHLSGIRYFDQLVVVRLSMDGRAVEEHNAMPWTNHLGRESAFLLSLPEGTYRLEAFRGMIHRGNYTVTYSVDFPEDYGTFDIVRGHVTELGTTIVHPDIGGQFGTIGLGRSDSERDLTPMVRTYLAQQAPDAEIRGIIGWNEREPGFDAANALERAFQRPFPSGQPVEDSAGRLLFPSHMGSVEVRMPSGIWRRVDSGRNLTLHSIEETPHGFIVAGAVGTVLVTPSLLETEWTEIPGLPREDEVVYAGHLDDNRLFAVTVHRRVTAVINRARPGTYIELWLSPELRLYLRDGIDDEWREVASFELEEDNREIVAYRNGDRVFAHFRQSRPHYSRRILAVDVVAAEIEEISEGQAFRRLERLAPQGGSAYFELGRVGGLGGTHTHAAFVQEGEMTQLPEMRHFVAPVRLDDGTLVGFGTKLTRPGPRESAQLVTLPGATVERDGKQEPYDPRSGTYFKLRPDATDWQPFAIRPSACIWPADLIVVGDRIIQRCALGITYSRSFEDEDWEIERRLIVPPITAEPEVEDD
jgi:hypothetical protein